MVWNRDKIKNVLNATLHSPLNLGWMFSSVSLAHKQASFSSHTDYSKYSLETLETFLSLLYLQIQEAKLFQPYSHIAVEDNRLEQAFGS